MTTVELHPWEKRTNDVKEAVERLFDLRQGAEREIFIAAMNQIRDGLDSLPESWGATAAVDRKAAIRAVAYGYQLLLASWEQTRAGRVSAARTMWRSAWEIPDYVIAFRDSKFLEEWMTLDGEGKTGGAARKAAERVIADMGSARANEWSGHRGELARKLHMESHVSASAVRNALLNTPSGTIMTPEGAFTETGVSDGYVLSRMALDLLWSFQITAGWALPAEWGTATEAFVAQGYEVLKTAFDGAWSSEVKGEDGASARS